VTAQSLKVVIPMAGLGTRLRPHTWSKPKQLVSVAGKAVLEHVIDTFHSLPSTYQIELVNIVGYLGEQIEAHMRQKYPDLAAQYVVQEDPRGQSHAIWLAREHLQGPMLMVFADTIIETDLSFLGKETADAVAWVKPVPDPRRFGVAVADANGKVHRLIEKPAEIDNNLAVVGFYYFHSAEALLQAIEEQMRRNVALKGEYYLADAINIMREGGMNMRVEKVDTWLDAGTPETLLETNHYLLAHGRDNVCDPNERPGVVIVPPVFIHPTAQVQHSVIGPYASLGADCQVHSSIIRNSILEDGAQVADVILEGSHIGRKASIHRRPGMINAGDHTVLSL